MTKVTMLLAVLLVSTLAYAGDTVYTPMEQNLDAEDYDITAVGDLQIKGPIVDIRAHGATPNDASDDTTEIQNAINSISGGTVFIPSGIFKTDSTLDVPQNTYLVGVGKAKSKIQYDGTDAVAVKIAHSSGSNYCSCSGLRNLQVLAATDGNGESKVGIEVVAGLYTELDSLVVSNFEDAGGVGVRVTGSGTNHSSIGVNITDSLIQGCRTGILLTSDDTADRSARATEIAIERTLITLPSSDIATIGIHMEYATIVRINSVGISTTLTTPSNPKGIVMENSSVTGYATIVGPTFEGLNTGIDIGSNIQAVTINNMHYHSVTTPVSDSGNGTMIVNKFSGDGYLKLGDNMNAEIDSGHLEVTTRTGEAKAAIIIDQNDDDQPVWDISGTSEAGTSKTISTYTSGNSIRGFVRVKVNSTTYWIPYYDAPMVKAMREKEELEIIKKKKMDELKSTIGLIEAEIDELARSVDEVMERLERSQFRHW